MVEEQQHGFAFQEWVIDLAKRLTPTMASRPSYTGKWDWPAELNPDPGGGPISIKTAKWKSSIGFGDAIRQFQINEDFTLVVGFWERTGARKRVVKVVCVVVSLDSWASLWKPITFADLKNLDAVIKNRSYDYEEARQHARRIVTAFPFTDSIFRTNPKIDSKHQRRLQCSLTQKNFFQHLAPGITPEKEVSPTLWNHAVPPFLPGHPRFGRT